MQVLVNLDCSGMITVFPECTVACFALIVLLRTAASYQLNTIRDDVSVTGVFIQEMNVLLRRSDPNQAAGRVAPGRCPPGAPTDPYVLALEHTVPQIMGSLRACKLSGPRAPAGAGNAGAGG